MCKENRHIIFLIATLAAALPARAEKLPPTGPETAAAVVRSSQTVSMPAMSSTRKDTDFSIVLVQNFNSRQVEANYSFRWDFGDVRHFIPNIISSVTKPMTDPGSLDFFNLMEVTRVRVYGVSVSPSKLFIAQRTAPLVSQEAVNAGKSDTAISPAPRRKERTLQFSIGPVVEDIKDNIGNSLRDALIDETFYSLSSKTSSVSMDRKKAVIDDLLSLDVLTSENVPVKKMLRPETVAN